MTAAGSAEVDCLCQAGAVQWIEVWFGDCVYTPWEIVGFCVGMSSVFFWLIAQMPQFVSNFLRQSADALSPWFLFQWLAGDSLNLLGCLLTGDQLATETFTAYYFIFADCLIISQYLYYHGRNSDRGYNFDESVHKPSNGYHTVLQIDPQGGSSIKPADLLSQENQKQDSKRQHQSAVTRLDQLHDIDDGKLQQLMHQLATPRGRQTQQQQLQQTACPRRQLRRVVLEYGLEYGPLSAAKLATLDTSRLPRVDPRRSSSRSSNPGLKKGLCLAASVLAGIPGSNAALQQNRKLLRDCPEDPTRQFWVKRTGTFFGWISSGLYLGSRVSQLVKNQERKSAEGLSLAMVSCAVLANLTYGAAILMRAKSMDDLIGKAPWLLGSLGTVSLDITIFLQAQYLSSKYAKDDDKPNERTPLLLT